MALPGRHPPPAQPPGVIIPRIRQYKRAGRARLDVKENKKKEKKEDLRSLFALEPRSCTPTAARYVSLRREGGYIGLASDEKAGIMSCIVPQPLSWPYSFPKPNAREANEEKEIE